MSKKININDYLNHIFGKLKIISINHYDSKGRIYFNAECTCENHTKVIIRRDHLHDTEIPSCGCAIYDKYKYDIIDRKFGKLIVKEYIKYDPKAPGPTREFKTFYRCECLNCGNINFITSRRKLLNEKIKSCGCMYNDLTNVPKEFVNIYRSIKQRCYNPNCKEYKNYGGRKIILKDGSIKYGIKMSDDWKIFNNFKNNMLALYIKHKKENRRDDGRYNTTLDRKDYNDDYKLSNCEWVTYEIQENNKTNTNYYTIKGYGDKKFTIRDILNNKKICDPGLSYDDLSHRINKSNKYCINNHIFNLDIFRNERYRAAMLKPIHFKDYSSIPLYKPIHYIKNNNKYKDIELPKTFTFKTKDDLNNN